MLTTPNNKIFLENMTTVNRWSKEIQCLSLCPPTVSLDVQLIYNTLPFKHTHSLQ